MKIYTRTGDQGSTGLFGGPRVNKDHDRIEAYGTVDELNAAIGMVRAMGVDSDSDQQLETVQNELFSIGAELATPDPDAHHMRLIGVTHISRLESWIDRHEQFLPELKSFILPSGSAAATTTHLARAICRRAERRVVTLGNQSCDGETAISESTLTYLNRLSDYLFVLARTINQQSGQPEIAWQRPATSEGQAAKPDA